MVVLVMVRISQNKVVIKVAEQVVVDVVTPRAAGGKR